MARAYSPLRLISSGLATACFLEDGVGDRNRRFHTLGRAMVACADAAEY
jgi:hypothetical protein